MSHEQSPTCSLCDNSIVGWRTINSDGWMRSIVSTPRFRPDHCLVLPLRHVVMPSELSTEEHAAIGREAGRLQELLNSDGYGAMIYQKFEPKRPDGVVKQSHLHYHVFSRNQADPTFPVPVPNSPDGFREAPLQDITLLLQRLRPDASASN